MQKKKELEKQIETKDHALKKYQIEMSELEKQKNSLQGQVVALRSELRTFSVDIPDHVKDDIDNYKKKVVLFFSTSLLFLQVLILVSVPSMSLFCWCRIESGIGTGNS